MPSGYYKFNAHIGPCIWRWAFVRCARRTHQDTTGGEERKKWFVNSICIDNRNGTTQISRELLFHFGSYH
jgi:hypothetical protein